MTNGESGTPSLGIRATASAPARGTAPVSAAARGAAGFEAGRPHDEPALGKRRRALRAIEVTFRGMAPRDALVYFVRRCAAVRRLHGDALKASLQHLPAQGFQVALELRSGGRTLRASAVHAAAIVAVCRAFEALSP